MQGAQPFSPIDLVKRFPKLRILVIGDALLDSYLEGKPARLNRDGPIPVVRKTTEQRLPGGAANVAANIVALGAHTCFLSVIGTDVAGEMLRPVLLQRGIDDQWLLAGSQVSTPHKLRIMVAGQHVARFDEGDEHVSLYTPETQVRLLRHLADLFQQCDAIVVSDYRYGVFSEEVIDNLRYLQQANPKSLLIDSQILERFCNFPATIVTPNYQELLLLAEEVGDISLKPNNFSLPDPLDRVEQIARGVREKLMAEYLAVTLADQGVLLMDRQEKTLHFPTHPVAPAHDVGAGDSLASGLILSLAAGGAIEEAIQVGIDAASIAVTKPRTAIVSHQELLHRVSLRVYTSQAQVAQENRLQTRINQLAALLEVERLAGRTIVFTNGVFDILHAGHIQFLKQAKALGNILVVAVNNDNSARALKGPGRPINSEQDRFALIDALDMVDYALLFDGNTATECIQAFHPDLYVKGSDYNNESLPETKVVQEIGGRVVILPLVGSLRTNQIIERIKRS